MFKIWDSFFADDANFFVGYPTKNGTYVFLLFFIYKSSYNNNTKKNTLEN